MRDLPIASKLRISLIATTVGIALLGALTVWTFQYLEDRYWLVTDLNRQQQVLSALDRDIVMIDNLLRKTLLSPDNTTQLQRSILAVAEDLVGQFSTFKLIAEKHNSLIDLSLVEEYEPLLYKLRTLLVNSIADFRKRGMGAVKDRYFLKLEAHLKVSREFAKDGLYDKKGRVALVVSEIERMYTVLKLFLGSIGMGILIILVIIHQKVARLIVGPIELLKTASSKISQGDLTCRVKMTSRDELGLLAKSFNVMVDNIENLVQSKEQYSQELKAANEEVKAFTYTVSHDLRAPLINVKGFASELAYGLTEIRSVMDKYLKNMNEGDLHIFHEVMDNDVPEALEFINSGIGRIDGQINAILKLSRLGQKKLKPVWVETDKLLKQLELSLKYQLETGKIEVEYKELPEVFTDQQAIEQIFANLLDNAVKYIPVSRQGKIEIGSSRQGEELVFYIRDNGCGIAEHHLSKIFELFRRVGDTEVSGEGMGLAYVKTLVKQLGGRVWCDSELNKGTTFSFSLPVYPASADQPEL